ncbi:hypothetical protein SAMN05428970_2328 [Agromyces sp. CF514]|nr:hypothetical protein SAMN05428970_2328 [Agromyces sp. CF514]
MGCNLARDQVMMSPTSHPAVDDHFCVTHVLVNELPSTLGTPEEPDHYSVSAVFSRRPTPAELTMLAAPNVGATLRDEGYAHVTLKPVDRRLVIGHTSLAELSGGLASLIGEVLFDIGTRARAEQRALDDTAAAHAQGEAQRAAKILEAVKRIDFGPSESRFRPQVSKYA